jgi:CSLREA domain-containing protein
MTQIRRVTALVSLCAALCALLLAVPPAARAANQTYTVTTTADTFPVPANQNCATLPQNTVNKCSLRSAIQLANSAPAGTTTEIKFRIPKTDPGYRSDTYLGRIVETWTISVTQPLDAIQHDGTIINGFSQEDDTPGTQNEFGPAVIIDGTILQAVANSAGLTVQASNTTIQGLGIVNFQYGGSLIGIGIEIRPNTDPSNPNTATGNTIQGCYIGVDKVGGTARSNLYGIRIQTAGNTVGGALSQPRERNVVSGNLADGILIDGGASNKIQGNYIGLDRNGIIAIPNGGDGVGVRAAFNTIIGVGPSDTSSARGNVISGNTLSGVHIYNGSGTQIHGNLIGLSADGASAVPNATSGAPSAATAAGVLIESAGAAAANNAVGTTNLFTRNVISGNQKANIRLQGIGTTTNTIVNNIVGPAFGGPGSPILPLPYSQDGIVLASGASRNRIGGTAPDEANYVAGNNGVGVRIFGYQQGSTIVNSDDNSVIGNFIGTDVSQTTPLPNAGAGVIVGPYANRTRIGGPTAPEANIIKYNAGDGVAIGNTNVVSNTVLKNIIQGNVGNGIRLNGAQQTVLDGKDTDSPLQVLENGANGIYATGGISPTITFSTIERNNGEGIWIDGGTPGAVIGNSTVASNTRNGVRFQGVSKALITAARLERNQANGVLVESPSQQVRITASQIYFNTLAGVSVSGAQRVTIDGNSISGNAVPSGTTYPPSANGNGQGIVLTPKTVGPPGSSSNANHDIDAPANLQMDEDGTLSGRVLATAGQPAACLPIASCAVQIFATDAATLDGQGKTKLGGNVTPASNGTFTAGFGTVPAQVALTATDAAGNTSEFGVFTTRLQPGDLTIAPLVPASAAQSAIPGQVITYTSTISNGSNINFKTLQLTAFSKLGWTYQLQPAGPIALAAGTSRPVTLTLTLPTGSVPNVRAGLIEETRVTIASSKFPTMTASLTDTTTVLSKFLLAVDPPTREVPALPGENAFFAHQLTNNGNVTATLSLATTTDRVGWTTVVTPGGSFTLAPGETRSILASVFVPPGTTAGTAATTQITINNLVDGAPDPSQVKTITDVTRAGTQPLAEIQPRENPTQDAANGQIVSFTHDVISGSNGPLPLRLEAYSSLGSRVQIVGIGGASFDPSDNSFTLPTGGVFNFSVSVTVNEQAKAGEEDQITLYLYDKASARILDIATDRVNVIRRLIVPRAYLPLAVNSAP